MPPLGLTGFESLNSEFGGRGGGGGGGGGTGAELPALGPGFGFESPPCMVTSCMLLVRLFKSGGSGGGGGGGGGGGWDGGATVDGFGGRIGAFG